MVACRARFAVNGPALAKKRNAAAAAQRQPNAEIISAWVLTTLATSIFLTLLASNTALAYSGGFAPSGANTIPVLLQFEAGHNPATTPGVPKPYHQQPPTTSGAAVLNNSKPGERLAQKDDFQQYFDRHFRAQRVINASPQHATNAQ